MHLFPIYFIVGNFDVDFILVNLVKIAKLKSRLYNFIVCMPMALRIQITKFKFCLYLLRANLPNLMLAKLSHYVVGILKILYLLYFTCSLYILTYDEIHGYQVIIARTGVTSLLETRLIF